MLKVLEIKVKQQIQKLARKEGAIWMHTSMGQRLVNKLTEIQALKEKMAA